MYRASAFLIAALAALPALAQSSYNTECRYERNGSDSRYTCTNTYTPAPKPYVPQSVHFGPGSREDIVVNRPQHVSSEPARPVTDNHCGAGYVYDPEEGCQLKNPIYRERWAR